MLQGARSLVALLALSLGVAALILPTPLSAQSTGQGGIVTVEWLGWSHLNGGQAHLPPWTSASGSSLSARVVVVPFQA